MIATLLYEDKKQPDSVYIKTFKNHLKNYNDNT
jgi:hypothetical protein